MSIRDKILAADDLPSKAVYVKKWDTTVYVRSMTGDERDEWEVEQFLFAKRDGGEVEVTARRDNIRARLLARVLVDEKGERIFTSDDAKALGKKSGAILDKLYEAALKQNAISQSDIDELAKN